MIEQPLPASEPEMATSFGSPVAFDDGTNRGEGAADPSGARTSPRVSRRARRHAEKEAVRAASNAETGNSSPADPSSLGAEPLEPVLAPAERRLLSRLTANRLAEV